MGLSAIGRPRKGDARWKVFVVGMPPMSESPHIGQAHSMGIGIGIFVVALGAILTFAVDWSIGGLDLRDVGWALMIAGVVGLILLSAPAKVIAVRANAPVAPVAASPSQGRPQES